MHGKSLRDFVTASRASHAAAPGRATTQYKDAGVPA